MIRPTAQGQKSVLVRLMIIPFNSPTIGFSVKVANRNEGIKKIFGPKIASILKVIVTVSKLPLCQTP
ncbi:MAG: hypothetical protein IT171_05810 [Acidobacteria bacterium]|nr:hypothetical protein [Acidobacteriota bacterium]